MDQQQEILSEICADLQQSLGRGELQIELRVLWVNQVEVLSHHPRQEPFVSQLLFVKVVDQQQYLDHVLFDNLRFEGRHLRPHLGLEELHQDGEQICVLFTVGGELGHDLARENDGALAQPVLDVGVDTELGWPIL